LRKILIIINKKAGTDRNKDIQTWIDQYLPKPAFEVELATLQYLGHGTDLAKKAVEDGVDTVVAVGGDGSINEIAKGLINTDTKLAIIPLGSGNGLARALSIPLHPAKAFQVLAGGKQRKMDVGYANGHLFLSNAGIGFDALIADQFQHSKKRGLINYARLVIGGFKNYQPGKYAIKSGTKELEQEAFLFTVANGNQFGYDFKIAGDASVFDGKLDICLVPPIGFWGLLPLTLHSLKGTVTRSKYMHHFTGQEIVVTGKDVDCLQVDGDAVPIGSPGQVTFKILPAAINIIIP